MIALLTDFGTSDIFVGVMKGVIASIAPAVPVTDITHGIDPQDIAGGSFALLASYRYFPEGTVFVAVVDPGVGTDRRPVAVRVGTKLFVCPDNGLLTGVLSESGADEAVVLDNPAFHLPLRVGATFHGRDIFAPVGAHLAAGRPLSEAGQPIDPESLVRLPASEPLFSGELIVAHIQHADRYGNLFTDLREEAFLRWSPVAPAFLIVELGPGPSRILPLCQAYGEVARGEPCLLFNSLALLEIAVNGGSAALAFGQPRSGAPVRIYRR
jgi:S-adenosylmethionine hydrolase